MVEILQQKMPPDIVEGAKLPGVQPLAPDGWISVDDAYAGQVAYKRELLDSRRDEVLYVSDPDAAAAITETFEEALALLPALGFSITQRHIFCPDGQAVDREADNLLAVLGRCIQEDICILIKRGDEHVLAAALLCFPASWTLAEKAGRPLTRLHRVVPEYDDALARRVQRLFDGVQVGRPIWRNNFLRYADPDLFQPRSENDPTRHDHAADDAPYLRAERQCIMRLPATRAAVFAIHTYVVKREL